MPSASAFQTLYPWKVQLFEQPRRAQSGYYAALGAGNGARTLDILRHNKIPVSPVLACAMHMQYLIPVHTDEAARIFHNEAGCQVSHTSDCSVPIRMGEPLAHGRFWLLPPDDVPQNDRTDFRDIYRAYLLQRRTPAAAARRTARQDQAPDPVEPLIAAAA